MTRLRVPTELFVEGRWVQGTSDTLQSSNPHDGSVFWQGARASHDQTAFAVTCAQKAGSTWRAAGLDVRRSIVETFAALVSQHRQALAALITCENGKPLWDADGEIAALLGKVSASLTALDERTGTTTRPMGPAMVETTHRPHGPMVVLGPFNFPLLLPGGHIIPALLAGNTVVFKPSESTPAVAAATVWLWEQAGLPDGVLNLVQGGVEVANTLMDHPAVRGVLFTGGTAAGVAIRRRLLDRPEVITALELGGNNPLVVWDASDVTAAARLAVRSAFVSSGQRCLCARRLIVSDDAAGDHLIDRVVDLAGRLRTGDPSGRPAPFNGPLIDAGAATRVLQAQSELEQLGARVLRRAQRPEGLGPAYLSPGVLDMTHVPEPPDREVFGPLLSVVRVSSFDEALHCANATRFGLSAALVSDREELFERFRADVIAGLVNFNTPTVAASGLAPFGGVGWSGNHRPAGFYAADYCAWPTATMRVPMPVDDAPLQGVDHDVSS